MVQCMCPSNETESSMSTVTRRPIPSSAWKPVQQDWLLLDLSRNESPWMKLTPLDELTRSERFALRNRFLGPEPTQPTSTTNFMLSPTSIRNHCNDLCHGWTNIVEVEVGMEKKDWISVITRMKTKEKTQTCKQASWKQRRRLRLASKRVKVSRDKYNFQFS